MERSCFWVERFWRWLVRWDKKPEQELALLHFAGALIAFRVVGIFGPALSGAELEPEHALGTHERHAWE